jgi:hypothetical protein
MKVFSISSGTPIFQIEGYGFIAELSMKTPGS